MADLDTLSLTVRFIRGDFFNLLSKSHTETNPYRFSFDWTNSQ